MVACELLGEGEGEEKGNGECAQVDHDVDENDKNDAAEATESVAEELFVVGPAHFTGFYKFLFDDLGLVMLF